MGVRLSLPEVLAAGSCALFCFGEYVAGTVFFISAIIAGFVRTTTEMQAAQQREARVNRVLEMVAAVGYHLAHMVSIADVSERSSRGESDTNYN